MVNTVNSQDIMLYIDNSIYDGLEDGDSDQILFDIISRSKLLMQMTEFENINER